MKVKCLNVKFLHVALTYEMFHLIDKETKFLFYQPIVILISMFAWKPYNFVLTRIASLTDSRLMKVTVMIKNFITFSWSYQFASIKLTKQKF